jgi:hypothetical protein
LADDDWSQKLAAAEGTTRALRHRKTFCVSVRDLVLPALGLIQ